MKCDCGKEAGGEPLGYLCQSCNDLNTQKRLLFKDGNPDIKKELYSIIVSAQRRIEKAIDAEDRNIGSEQGYTHWEIHDMLNRIKRESDNLDTILLALNHITVEELKSHRDSIAGRPVFFDDNYRGEIRS